jgi:hypothetical protein
MPPYFLRLAYVAQFLLALIAVWTVWGQVGGQDHLDLMPWYAKLALSVTLSWVVVMGTMAAVAERRVWNGKVIAYFVIGLCIAAGMAALTYYYHVHENDGGDEDSVTTTALIHAVPEAKASLC